MRFDTNEGDDEMGETIAEWTVVLMVVLGPILLVLPWPKGWEKKEKGE